MENGVAVLEKGRAAVAVQYTSEQIGLIKTQVAKDCSDGELALFLYQCQRTGLDALNRQIYAIKRGNKMSIQTSIDGFRLIAERSGKYEGQTPVMWCGEDAQWVEVWLKPGAPAAAKVGVYRAGFRDAVYAIAKWSEYADAFGPMWKKMGAHMLAKCAESLALRKAFPQELSGLYTSDEMQQAEQEPEDKGRTRAQELGHFANGVPMEQHLANLELREAKAETSTKAEAFDQATQPDTKPGQRDLGTFLATIKSGRPVKSGKSAKGAWTLYEIVTEEEGAIKTFDKGIYDLCGEAVEKNLPIYLECEPSGKGPTINRAYFE
jgi:phage recombination protein Bet